MLLVFIFNFCRRFLTSDYANYCLCSETIFSRFDVQRGMKTIFPHGSKTSFCDSHLCSSWSSFILWEFQSFSFFAVVGVCLSPHYRHLFSVFLLVLVRIVSFSRSPSDSRCRVKKRMKIYFHFYHQLNLRLHQKRCEINEWRNFYQWLRWWLWNCANYSRILTWVALLLG